MDIKILALLVLVGVLGSLTEVQSAFVNYPRNGEVRSDKPPIMAFIMQPRLKREVDDSNGETANSSETTTKSTTTPASTTTSSSTPAMTTDPTTTPPSTTPTTSPTTPSPETTTPSTTIETTTPTTTTETTTPTTTPTTPTTPTTVTPESTTPASSTTPDSMKSTPKSKKPNVQSRSNLDDSDDPEDSSKKPGPSSKATTPAPGPSFGPSVPGPSFNPYFGSGFGSGFDPYFGYPGLNSIPGSGQNYAWTDTNSGSGYASAGASAGAGSFAGGYPGTEGFPTGPSIGSRGGFQDNTPAQMYPTGYYPNAIDPLYNAGPGFFFPGQYSAYDPSFDMFKQIQAQIEAQHQAIANAMASHHAYVANQRGAFANIPNYAYSYASANINNMGRHPMYGSIDLNVGNRNMEFHNRLANEAANYDSSYGGYGGYGVPQVASASIDLGPNGGFQTGQISPAAPGIASRFGEDIPAPAGNSYGVFASSSSSSMTGPDGKQVNHKSSITGVNDNGKVTYRTVHD